MAVIVNVVTGVAEIAVSSVPFASVVFISGFGEADVFVFLASVEGFFVKSVAVVKSSLAVVDVVDIGVIDRVDTGVAGTNVVELKAAVVRVTYVVFCVKFILP